MLSRWELVETCSGSAAITLALLGSKQQLIPYQGSKWRYRRQLQALFMRLGFWGSPSSVVLQDVSGWDEVVCSLLKKATKHQIIDHLKRLVAEGETDPMGLWDRLVTSQVPSDCMERYAVQLWLQRMSYGGKAIGPVWRSEPEPGFYWSVHGISKTSALGDPGDESFGEIKPQGAGLLRIVTELPCFDSVLTYDPDAIPRQQKGLRRLTYIDPPYEGTSPYPSGDLSRLGVVELALAHAATGAAVVVSEDEPIEYLARLGWASERLSAGKEGESPLKTKKEEWVTFLRGTP